MTWMQPKDHFHDFDASFMLHFLYWHLVVWMEQNANCKCCQVLMRVCKCIQNQPSFIYSAMKNVQYYGYYLDEDSRIQLVMWSHYDSPHEATLHVE